MIWFFCLGIIFIQGTVCAEFQWGRADEDNNTCNGSMQSPILIRKTHVLVRVMEDIQYHGYEVRRHNMTVLNDGHTAILTLADDDDKKPYIDLGGLDGKYNFTELHFHWGLDDSKGAEHIFLPPKGTALEVHFVHTNFDEATGETRIAFLGMTFRPSPSNDTDYAPITNTFKDIRYKGQNAATGGFSLDSLLPSMSVRNSFYRYNGSLTMSPCTEGVIWNVYESFRVMGKNQLQEFRSLLATPEGSEEKNIAPNFRETQDLNGRTILFKAGGTRPTLPTRVTLPTRATRPIRPIRPNPLTL